MRRSTYRWRTLKLLRGLMEKEGTMNEAQHRILKMLEAGTITAVEANRLLAALSGRPLPPPEARPDPRPVPPVEPVPAVEAMPVTEAPEPSARPVPASLADVAALAAASSAEVLRQVAREESAGDGAASTPGETPTEGDESGPRRRRWRWW